MSEKQIKLDELDVDGMSVDDIVSLDLEKLTQGPVTDKPTDPPPKADEAIPPDDKVDPEKKLEAEKQADKPDPDKIDDPKEPAKDPENDLPIEKRFKDTQATLTKTTTENKALKERLEKLEKEEAELRQKHHELSMKSFKKLPEGDLDDMKVDDPDSYLDYKENERIHAQKEKEFQETIKTEAKDKAFNAQQDEIVDFISKVKKIDTSDEAELTKYLKSDEWRELDKLMVDKEGPFRPNAQGVYTQKTLKIALGHLTEEKRNLDVVNTTVQKTLDSIQKAGNGGSKLDKVVQDPLDKLEKSIENLTDNDIANMNEEEAEQYLKKSGSTRDVAAVK